jgi:lipopolysaccharide/colanic/teichoic acid biosynthesis glycosyltransferase
MELMTINQPSIIPRRLGYRIAKRVMDIVLCLLILPVALPIMVVCALAIYFDSPGPVVFVQERIGRGGRLFRMYKFRTLICGSDDSNCRAFMQAFVRGQLDCGDEDEEIFKPMRGPQITRAGRILRKTSADELPQIINVLRGEMSWVGPRPNVPCEVEVYRPWHHERLELLPGITGLAQVRGRSRIKFDTIVNYDIEYLEKQSLMLDLKILWWTLFALINNCGAK